MQVLRAAAVHLLTSTVYSARRTSVHEVDLYPCGAVQVVLGAHALVRKDLERWAGKQADGSRWEQRGAERNREEQRGRAERRHNKSREERKRRHNKSREERNRSREAQGEVAGRHADRSI